MKNPLIHYQLIPTRDSDSYKNMKENETGLPLPPHVGAFAVPRKYHTHEGIDLYAPQGTPVCAIEDGIVVNIIPFTGAHTTPPTPWWHNTDAVLVEGTSGVFVYGEITPVSALKVGQKINAGDIVGYIARVLKKDKGRPRDMLHLELYTPGTRDTFAWETGVKKIESLLDPTPALMKIARHQKHPKK
ncbi:MAG: M23 family metallopeptidase [Lactobacillales bacterium]|jgi:murein DD-endopeptidase MepM/ murein hydrolase activator NlpD|nr:M23 family metallopeptidase [Lactobacillales bacterium]